VIVGLGIDAIDILRVEQLMVRHPERAVRRLFTAQEVSYARARIEPARHYAARIAAKEAAYKALAGNELARSVGWREIEVTQGPDGRPALSLSGKAARRASEMHADRVWVSLSHSDHAAVAVVVLERGGA
jgi:holo-[acyl-carrier protein] synthase